MGDFENVRRRLAAGARARAADLRGLVAQICGSVVLAEKIDQGLRAPAGERHHPAPVLGRADGRQRRDSLGRVAAGLAVEAGGAVDPIHQVEFGILRDRVVDGAMQRLHAPVPLAVDQGRDDIHADLLAGDMVRMPHLRRDRRRIVGPVRLGVVAAVHHRPAQRQMDQVRAAVVGPRPIVAERRHPCANRRYRQVVKRPARRRVQHDISRRGQPREIRPPSLRVKVKHDRPLAQPVVPPKQRALRPSLILIERPVPPRSRPARRLNHDHISPHPRKQPPRIRSQLIADLNDADAIQQCIFWHGKTLTWAAELLMRHSD